MTNDPLELVALLGADPEPTPRGADIAHGRLLDRIHGLPEGHELPVSTSALARSAAGTGPRAALLAGALVLLIALLVSGWVGLSPLGGSAERARADAAQQVVRELPYPPGQADTARVVLRTSGERRSVAEQAQYRAWCKWLAYWLDRRAAGDAAGARAASLVLAASSQWAELRAAGEPADAVATATGRGSVRSAQLLAAARCPTFV